MTNVIVYHRSGKIKIVDENTYKDVEIMFECEEEKQVFLRQLIKDLLKEDE